MNIGSPPRRSTATTPSNALETGFWLGQVLARFATARPDGDCPCNGLRAHLQQLGDTREAAQLRTLRDRLGEDLQPCPACRAAATTTRKARK